VRLVVDLGRPSLVASVDSELSACSQTRGFTVKIEGKEI
jgi:hypothetical protein